MDEEPDEDSNDNQDELLDTLKQNGATQLQQASVSNIPVEVGKVISCIKSHNGC